MIKSVLIILSLLVSVQFSYSRAPEGRAPSSAPDNEICRLFGMSNDPEKIARRHLYVTDPTENFRCLDNAEFSLAASKCCSEKWNASTHLCVASASHPGLVGEDCFSDSDCCSESCLTVSNGHKKCVGHGKTYCAYPGDYCIGDMQCCSGSCDKSSHQCLGNRALGPDFSARYGSFCLHDGNCQEGLHCLKSPNQPNRCL